MNGHTTAVIPLMRSITAKNLLSFGPKGVTLELKPLNVLVGPNGSGKSNLLEVVGLFKAAPRELTVPIVWGGDVREWIWKGRPRSTALAEVVVSNPSGVMPLRHKIAFAEVEQRFELVDERIENEAPQFEHDDVFFFYRFNEGAPVLSVREQDQRQLRRQDVESDESILSQWRDPHQLPELTYLSNAYRRIRLYRDWEFGPNMAIREPQRANMGRTTLWGSFRNIGPFLNKLEQSPRTRSNINDKLSDLYDGLNDFRLNFEGGTVQVVFTEGDFAIPATRLSDGSLRYLCLLAILLDPDPPPLIGIEEPELGLHPDLIPGIARLLIDASKRCQLIVTTHSDILVDALTEYPESVVVCEKHEGQTTMKRLRQTELDRWLTKYRLGQLWTKGELGGVRW